MRLPLTSTLLLLAASSIAHAATAAGPLTLGDSPFQVLKDNFNSASFAAISDFPTMVDFGGSNPSYQCVASVGSDNIGMSPNPGGLVPVIVGRVDITGPGIPANPGTPGNGPLFPGNPATPAQAGVTASALIPFFNPDFGKGWTNDQWSTDLTSGDDAGVFTTSTLASGELQTITTYTSFGPKAQWTDTYRKSGALLFIHEKTSGSDQNSTAIRGEIYGYCYPSK